MRYLFGFFCVCALGVVPLLAASVAGCGGGEGGPTVEVEVSGAGIGQGEVRGLAGQTTPIACRIEEGDTGGGCQSAFLDLGGVGTFTLTATPDAGSVFGGWSATCSADAGSCSTSECTGSDAGCTLSFNARDFKDGVDVTFDVTAAFDLASGTAVSCQTACPDRQCDEFSDDRFEEATWEHVAVFQAAGTEYDVSQGTDEQGNLDPYRFVSHRLVPPPNVNELSISVAHGNTNAVYDPNADRAIHSLHYSYDGRALPGSRQASIRPLAKQGGKWFWTAFDSERVLINEGDWVTREWPTASLIGFGHAGQLDLTENGTEITFGFSTAASHKGTSPTTRNTGVDNWRVVICKE